MGPGMSGALLNSPMMNFRAIIISAIIGILPLTSIKAESVKVSSADKKLKIELSVDKGQAYYSVSYEGRQVVAPSVIALDFEGGLFGNNVRITESKTEMVHDSYDLPVGKTSHVECDSRQAVVTLSEKKADGRKVNVIMRAFDEAVAFRYEVPQQDGMEGFILKNERMDMNLPSDSYSMILPFWTFNNTHEGNYFRKPVSELPADCVFDLPATFKVKDEVFVTFTEANVVNYAGMYLRRNETSLTSVLSPRLDRPELSVIAELPHKTPWRVFFVGKNIGKFVESNVLTTLCDPCKIDDLSWLKPGKTTFTWWCDNQIPEGNFQPGNNFQTNKYYIDFAAENNLEYHSVYGYADMPWYYDDGPTFGLAGPNADLTRHDPRLDFPRVCSYAASKGVGIHVWLNWAALYKDIDRVFDKFNEWGVKGMMVDFMDRDDQEMILIQEDILRKAAEHKLFIQFHGSSKPSGLNRTYPNEFTREGALNYEVYKWNGWQLGADHDINMPFTRVIAGATDYHLGGFRAVTIENYKPQYSHPLVTNTRAHMLAMYVVLESYLHMVADYPMAYIGQKGLDFLSQVPTTWDETVVPSCSFEEYFTVARRKGDDWFIGAISDSKARTVDMKMDFLEDGEYEATWYKDCPDSSENPNNIEIETIKVRKGDVLKLELAATGGCAIILRRCR